MIQSCVTKNSLPRLIEPVHASDNSVAMTGLLIFDDEYRYAHIDPYLAEIHGLTVAAVRGKHIEEVLPQLATLVKPMLQKVLLLGQPILGHTLTYQQRKHSELNRDWLVSYYPLLATNGKVIGVISIMIGLGD
ncbi:MAG: PAS domain-containing protein [Pantanalinema sp. GBBB05]|nr:PAS domain-containing protein [Pantanalinema sp. GBBB05]